MKVDIYFFCRQWITFLIAIKASTSVVFEYTEFADVFFPDFIIELPEYAKIKNIPINLIDSPQSLYSSIYSLEFAN